MEIYTAKLMYINWEKLCHGLVTRQLCPVIPQRTKIKHKERGRRHKTSSNDSDLTNNFYKQKTGIKCISELRNKQFKKISRSF